jgi:hypothetical protein
VAHPPINTSKMSSFVSDETREPKEYILRNQDIVNESNKVYAAPYQAKEILRSGTWATVRYAKRKIKGATVIHP